jgi:hypothetical protein
MARTLVAQGGASSWGPRSATPRPAPVASKPTLREIPAQMHKQHCETCGKAFLPRPSGGHPQRFCSRPCRHQAAASRQQMEYTAKRSARRQAAVLASEEGTAGRICPGCGAMFAPIRRTALYCSFKCKQRVYRQRHPRIHERHCETCGTAFLARLGGQP